MELTKEQFKEFLDEAATLAAVEPDVAELLRAAAQVEDHSKPAPHQRRSSPRLMVQQVVNVQRIGQGQPAPFRAMLWDISCDGVGLRSSIPFSGSFALQLQSDDGSNLLVTCEVTYCGEAKGIYLIGARFNSVSGFMPKTSTGGASTEAA